MARTKLITRTNEEGVNLLKSFGGDIFTEYRLSDIDKCKILNEHIESVNKEMKEHEEKYKIKYCNLK